MNVRRVVKELFRKAGLEVRLVKNVRRIKQDAARERHLKPWRFLENQNIRTVIDVGANEGQFAEMIHGKCPEAALICFEPLPSCFAKLEQTLSTIPRSKAYNLGVGHRPETLEMNQSASSPSSSFLTMTEAHRTLWPETAAHTKERVEVVRLDDLADELTLESDILIKIDTQGYEHHVIQGGSNVIKACKYVVIETNFVLFYENQPTFDVLYRALYELGFQFRGMIEQFFDKETGKILFADALFVRADE